MKIRSTLNQVEVDSPAKVNLFLEILGKRSDGFHELETVMSTVNVFDSIRFCRRDDDEINLTLVNRGSSGTHESIPTDDRNLIVKALRLLRARIQQHGEENHAETISNTRRPLGCDITLDKRIPSEAGLGGASSNAVAALLAGNLLWKAGLSIECLDELAAQIGSDVPFFLYGGTALCRGRGEKITPLECPAGLSLVIVKPQGGLSTAKVFGNVAGAFGSKSSDLAIQSVASGHPNLIASSLFNRLQSVAIQMSSDIVRTADAFENIDCLGHQMSGSGTGYFGVFPTVRSARRAARTLSSRLPNARILFGQTLCPNVYTAT